MNRRSAGRLFQAWGPATGKARSPMVARHVADTRTWAVDAERSRRLFNLVYCHDLRHLIEVKLETKQTKMPFYCPFSRYSWVRRCCHKGKTYWNNHWLVLPATQPIMSKHHRKTQWFGRLCFADKVSAPMSNQQCQSTEGNRMFI